MAGGLKPPPQESKAVGYCCFIVVMPARGVWYQQVFTVALTWLSIIIIISVVPPSSHSSLDKRGETQRARCTETNQAHVHLRLDRHALDPHPPPPTSLSVGMDPAGETPRVSSILMGIIWSICLA